MGTFKFKVSKLKKTYVPLCLSGFIILAINISLKVYYSSKKSKKSEHLIAQKVQKSKCTNSDLGNSPRLVVLGIAQDGGYPHAGSRTKNSLRVWESYEAERRFAASVALVDPKSEKRWIFDVTPNFKEQLYLLDCLTFVPSDTHEGQPALHGIFLTHAHEGHYAGLIHFSRPMMNTLNIPVHVMPKMHAFLNENAPWNLMVKFGNISLRPLKHRETVMLTDELKVTPILVPHRGELSETVGFRIKGPNKSVLYIPDIDKWEAMELVTGCTIEDLIAEVDYAFLDGTFFDGNELPGRDMSEVPHPLVEDSMKRFTKLSEAQKKKVHFIHLNHTNKILWDTAHHSNVTKQGFCVSEQGQQITL